MIGPVSGTGRAMMASLQQAIQKGMPPDQAIQYVKSMATQGVAPLADLYAMLNQFQRLKQQPVQAPQTPPTIRDQLNMMEQQQAMMQQGVASLPAPVMDQAQFAGGGIVAFSEGGTPYDIEGIYARGKPRTDDIFDPAKLSIFAERGSAEDLARLYALSLSRGDLDTAGRLEPYLNRKGVSSGQLNEIRKKTVQGVSSVREANEVAQREAEAQQFLTGQAAPTQTAVPTTSSAPVTRRETPPAAPRTDTTSRGDIGSRVPAAPRVAAEAPAEKKMTLEDFMAPLREADKPLQEARENYLKHLASEEASAKEQSGRDRMLALAQAGFGMAQAASKPGATFLGSVGAAGGDYAKTMMQLNREADAAKRGIIKERLAMAQAQAAGNKENYIAAYQNMTAHEKTLVEADRFKQELGLRREGLDIQRAELALRNTGLNAEIARAAARDARDDRDYLQKVHEFTVGARIKVAELAREETADLIRTPTYIDATPEVQEQMIQDIHNRIAQQVYGGSGTGVGGGASTGFSAREVTPKPTR